MKKKAYTKPTAKAHELRTTTVICTPPHPTMDLWVSRVK